MASVEETIREKLHTLPLDKQQEVLQFIERLSSATGPESVSLVDEITGIFQDVPDAAWDALSRDGSENLDHYLYGAPKK